MFWLVNRKSNCFISVKQAKIFLDRGSPFCITAFDEEKQMVVRLSNAISIPILLALQAGDDYMFFALVGVVRGSTDFNLSTHRGQHCRVFPLCEKKC